MTQQHKYGAPSEEQTDTDIALDPLLHEETS